MPSLAALASRLVRSLRTWPSVRGWGESAAIGAGTLALVGAVGFSTGLYKLGPPALDGLAVRLATVVFVPGLGEELPFRGLMIPGRTETERLPWRALAIMTPVFVAWHVVEAKLILPAAAPTFLRPDFLACAAILGLGCGLVRWRASSIWPAVGLHAVMVTLWQTWLGGFRL